MNCGRGPTALPHLLATLLVCASLPGHASADAATDTHLVSLVERLEHPLSAARRDAALAIAAAGRDDAIPALVDALDDVNVQVRRAVVSALATVGAGSDDAAAGLVIALSDDDWVVRRRAALAFEDMPATSVVAAIRPLMGSDSMDIRTSAALALAGLAPHSRAALPELVSALGDGDWQLRAASAHAIGALGGDGADGIPALSKALRDRDWGVAEQVVEALTRIGKPSVPVLIDALADPGLPVRWGAARALGRIGPQARDAVQGLAALLEDDAMQVRWAAAKALWAMGPAAAAAAAALAEALDDTSWSVRWSAARALGSTSAESVLDITVAALADGLADRDSRVCEAAAFALEQIGPPAVAALPALIRSAQHDPSNNDTDAADVQCQVIDVGPAAEHVLMQSGWTVRWASVRALGVVGMGRNETQAALARAIRDEQWQVRGVALLAAGQLDQRLHPEVIEALVDGTTDEQPAVRKAALIALGEAGQPSQRSVIAIRAAIEDNDPAVRAAAEQSMLKLSIGRPGDET